MKGHIIRLLNLGCTVCYATFEHAAVDINLSSMQRWLKKHFLIYTLQLELWDLKPWWNWAARVWQQMWVLLLIQGSRVRSQPGPILSWRLIMKYFLRSFSSLPLNHLRRVVVSYKWKYVHKVLVNCLFKLAQEKVWLGELTIPPWP